MQAWLYDLLLFYQQQPGVVEMGQFTSGKIVTVTLLAGIFGCLAIKTMDPKEIEISPGVSCCEQKVLKPKGQWTCLLEKETFTNYQDFTA